MFEERGDKKNSNRQKKGEKKTRGNKRMQRRVYQNSNTREMEVTDTRKQNEKKRKNNVLACCRDGFCSHFRKQSGLKKKKAGIKKNPNTNKTKEGSAVILNVALQLDFLRRCPGFLLDRSQCNTTQSVKYTCSFPRQTINYQTSNRKNEMYRVWSIYIESGR